MRRYFLLSTALTPLKLFNPRVLELQIEEASIGRTTTLPHNVGYCYPEPGQDTEYASLLYNEQQVRILASARGFLTLCHPLYELV